MNIHKPTMQQSTERFSQLASLHGSLENISIHTVVVPELELVYIKLNVFFTYAMVGANNAALEDRPEAFDGVCMNRTGNVLAFAVADHAMREVIADIPVSSVFIGGKQADLVAHSLADKAFQRVCVGAVDYAGDHIALATDSANDRYFARRTTASATSAARLVIIAVFLVLVLRLAAYIRFIHFHVADKLLKFSIAQSCANFVTHIQGGTVGTKPHDAVDLQGANAFLAGQHHVHNAEPFTKRFIGVLEYCADKYRKTVANAIRRAIIAIPVSFHCAVRKHPYIATAGANSAIRPAVDLQILPASQLSRKQDFKLLDSHLVNLWAFGRLAHGLSPNDRSIRPC